MARDAPAQPPQTILQRLLQHMGFALVGALTAACFAYFASGSKTGREPLLDESLPSVESGPAPVPPSTIDPAMWLTVWKPAAGVGLIVLIEIMQEYELNGWREFRLMHVLKCRTFREQLRRLVRGQGLTPMATPAPPAPPAPPTAEEQAEAEADAAAVAYANARAAQWALARLRVDHLVYGMPGPLSEAMAHFEKNTGVAPVVGGSHPDLGTHNALVSLGGGAYFEILCRDPGQPSPPRTWMGIESLEGPAMLTWATDRGDVARAAGYDPGDVEDFERAKPDGSRLRWRLAYRHYTRSQMGAGGGIVPFLIDWKGNATPAASAPNGCELVSLRAESRDAAAVAKSLRALGIDPADLSLKQADADRLVATIRTPNGLVEFA